MVRYPKFLNSTPQFWGLSLPDIVLFAVGINVFYHLGLEVFLALGFSILLVFLRRVAIKWIDFKGILVSYPKVGTLAWADEIRGGNL